MRRPSLSVLVITVLVYLTSTFCMPPVVSAADGQTISDVINTAVAVHRVPRDLTPTLASVASVDTVWTVQGASLVARCNPAGNPGQLTKPIPCLMGDTNSSKVMVLFGDSNAASWTPAINYAAKKLHFRLDVFIFLGCSSQIQSPQSVTTTTLGASASVLKQCNVYHRHLAKAVQSLHPTVLVSARVGMDGGGSGPQDWNAYGRDWNYTFNLLSQGRTVTKRVILGTTPNDGPSKGPGEVTNIPACIARHPTDILPCSPSYVIGKNTLWSYQRYLHRDQIAASVAHAKLISTTQWFCQSIASGTAHCPGIIGKYLVYVDQDHISTAYMLTIAPLLLHSLQVAGI